VLRRAMASGASESCEGAAEGDADDSLATEGSEVGHGRHVSQSCSIGAGRSGTGSRGRSRSAGVSDVVRPQPSQR
jgi:hypothetical protein